MLTTGSHKYTLVIQDNHLVLGCILQLLIVYEHNLTYRYIKWWTGEEVDRKISLLKKLIKAGWERGGEDELLKINYQWILIFPFNLKGPNCQVQKLHLYDCKL